MDNKLTAEEERHLRATILYHEAHGAKNLVKQIEDVTPEKQRFVISFHHG
jgi:hypothetical protein